MTFEVLITASQQGALVLHTESRTYRVEAKCTGAARDLAIAMAYAEGLEHVGIRKVLEVR